MNLKLFHTAFVNVVLIGCCFSSIASQRCDLQGKTITLSIQMCLEEPGSQQCVDEVDNYNLRLIDNQIHLQKGLGVALQIELGHPPKDILNDKGHLDYFEDLNRRHPTDVYKKYSVSALQRGRSIQLHTSIDKVLFGRWRSSTRTDYELSFDQGCRACALTHFTAVTDKVGFSLNHQTAGESTCVIE